LVKKRKKIAPKENTADKYHEEKKRGNENWSRSLVFQLGKSRSLGLYPTQIFNKRRPCSRR
jgi:hypothetical protein